MKRSPPAIVCLRMVVGRHGVQVRFRDLDVVAEDAVVPDLERRDARAHALALLEFGDHLLAGAADVGAAASSSGSRPSRMKPPSRAERRRLVDDVPDRCASRTSCRSSSRLTSAGRAGRRARRAPMRMRGTAEIDCLRPTRSRGPRCSGRCARRGARDREPTFRGSRNLPRSVVRNASSSTASSRSRIRSSDSERPQQPRPEEPPAHRRHGAIDLVQQRSRRGRPQSTRPPRDAARVIGSTSRQSALALNVTDRTCARSAFWVSRR